MLSKSVFRKNFVNVTREAFCCFVKIDRHVASSQKCCKSVYVFIFFISVYNYRIYFYTSFFEPFNESYTLFFIGQTGIVVQFVRNNILRMNCYNNFHFVFHLFEQCRLYVLIITRKNPCCVFVAKKFATEFQIKLLKSRNPLQNKIRLFINVFFIRKSNLHAYHLSYNFTTRFLFIQ